MQLFSRIPDRFFSILVSSNKELYVQALFVLRQAFKTELTIRREELVAMLINSLEVSISEADFSVEAEEEGSSPDAVRNLSEKAHLLLRRLKETGWIETEYEARTFDEQITIPDYAVAVMNLLYDLSNEKIREYNSYVYATYATLINAKDTPDYTFQALQAAYQNTVQLVDELKTLFNNIRRYYRMIPGQQDVNQLLKEHFDDYKVRIFDAVYYPLKTMDSVPRFKHAILAVINEWIAEDEVQERLVQQAVSRHVFETGEEGAEQINRMLNYIADTYDGIESMLDEIDRKHNEYTNASIEHIRYLMNSDRGVKGNLIELLKYTNDEKIINAMAESITVGEHAFIDLKSLYSAVKRTRKTEGAPLALESREEQPDLVIGFLEDIRRQYTNEKIDNYVEECLNGEVSFRTEKARMENSEDFILFLLSAIRGKEKNAPFSVTFEEGNVQNNGYSLPHACFQKKS